MIWIGFVMVSFYTYCIFEDFDVSFCSSSKFFSEHLVIFLFLLATFFIFGLLKSFLNTFIMTLRWQFSSCFYRSFLFMSSLECSVLWIIFNLWIFVTNIFLWVLRQNIYLVLSDNMLLSFVISNLSSFLVLSFLCRSSFICCWCRHIFDSWPSNFP